MLFISIDNWCKFFIPLRIYIYIKLQKAVKITIREFCVQLIAIQPYDTEVVMFDFVHQTLIKLRNNIQSIWWRILNRFGIFMLENIKCQFLMYSSKELSSKVKILISRHKSIHFTYVNVSIVRSMCLVLQFDCILIDKFKHYYLSITELYGNKLYTELSDSDFYVILKFHIYSY